MHWGNGSFSSPFGWIMMIIGMLFWIAFLALLVVGVIYLIRYLGTMGGGPPRAKMGEDPLDVAKRRYAAGEITKEQYEELKRNLTI